MHQALLIDEIIRYIFDLCGEEGRCSLALLARCCKAWKDPALDTLWSRLPSTTPLFCLIPRVLEKDGTFSIERTVDVTSEELQPFYSYAIRVKSIIHRRQRAVEPLPISLLRTICLGHVYILPKLVRVHISVSNWDALTMATSLSDKLHHLTLDLGFSKARTYTKGWSNDIMAAEYLEIVARTTSLQRLDLRGMALSPDRLNRTLTCLKSLQVLSLATGKSLTVNTLTAIAAFPRLSELEIHASHINADEFADSTAAHESPLFPALQILHIRAQAPLVEFLLQKMPSDNLRCLTIEAAQPVQPPSIWTSAFSLISTKTCNSLRELTVEHHIDPAIETESTSDNILPQPIILESRSQFTIAALRPLANLPHLRRLVIETTIAPDLCDADIEELAKWWPDLEHLDLGGLLSDIECPGELQKSRASLRCLEDLSRLCPRLETLVINLDIDYADTSDAKPNDPWLSRHPLRYLTMGSISAPEPLRLSQYLHRVFPSLIEVEGVSAHEEEWCIVQSILHNLQKPHGCSPCEV